MLSNKAVQKTKAKQEKKSAVEDKSERSLTVSLTFCEMNEMYLWNEYEEIAKNLNLKYLYFQFLKI